ncbi:MAG: YlbF family regulator [Phycisphaerales bacterium]|nr:YlbF family regulator [Phycisphaerales bacterium]
MEEIISEAKALGQKIAEHPRMKEFMAATRAVEQDSNAQAILRKYQEQVQKIRELEQTGKPIEVTDKQALADCEAEVAGNDLLKEMIRTQADYVELMQQINSAIDEAAATAQRQS